MRAARNERVRAAIMGIISCDGVYVRAARNERVRAARNERVRAARNERVRAVSNEGYRLTSCKDWDMREMRIESASPMLWQWGV